MCRGRHDDESNDGNLRAHLLQSVVETGEGLDEHVCTLIAILISSSGEEVQGVVEVNVTHVTIEVTFDEFIDLSLGHRMQVLEFVHGLELLHVETVGQDPIRFTLEQMLSFPSGDMGRRGEDIRGMRGGALDAVAMVDTALTGLMVDVDGLDGVIKVKRASTEVATQEGGVRLCVRLSVEKGRR